MTNEARIEKIQDLQVKSRVEDVAEPGSKEKVPVLVTTVQFKYEGGPGMLQNLLFASAAGQVINVEMESPQSLLDMMKDKHQNEHEARIDINLDAECTRCGKEGATQNGLCLKCIEDGIKHGTH